MIFAIKRNKDNKYLNLITNLEFKKFIIEKVIKWVDNLEDAKIFFNMKAAEDTIHIILKGRPGEYSIMRITER